MSKRPTAKKPRPKWQEEDTKPGVLFAKLLLIVFAVAAIVMVALAALPEEMPEVVLAGINAFALTIVAAPAIWWVIATPLRKAVEADGLRAEAGLVGILEGSSDAIITLDDEYKIVLFSRGAEKIFGYQASELRGQPLDLLLPEESRQRHVGLVEGFAEGPVSARAMSERATLSARRRDGTLFPAEISISKAVRGDSMMVTAILRDVTQRQAVEAELREAKNAAESATRAKSEFLANMSHEIRTPMNAVIGMTGLLLDTGLDPEQREFVQTVRGSGDALLTIINDILDFSKIESGHLVLEESAFDLRDCVESALDLVAGRAAEKGVDLAYLVEEGVPATLVGDVTRLRQVLVNLLSNAVKFTAAGEVFVSVSARALDDGRCELHCAVRDTGIGIPADRLDRLFRSFSQVDASTTRQFGGTGLGLAISKRLAELMGGDMWVESTPGEGSTFHFRIVALPGQSTRRVFLSGVHASLEGRRLLVVDDHATNRRIIEQYARSWGARVIPAASGAEALDAVSRGESYDVAILDMQMPQMDGEMLAAELRRRLAEHTPPMMLLTSLGRGASSPESSFATVLTKPVKPSQLFDALIAILSGATVRRGSTAPGTAIDRDFARRHPMRVLLAEDNPVNQLVATRILERFGYRVDVVGNGLEALAAVDQVPYDLVLMDMQMPEMDGLEATRQIHRLVPAVRRPRIVAMTASAMDSDRDACLAAGMDDYIAKPVRVEVLQEALERSFAARGAR